MDATLSLFDDYRVSLDAFEGPLDLLLHLIRKEEVSITDIPIERITAQYLAYLDRWRALDVNLAGEFVVMAATLLEINADETDHVALIAGLLSKLTGKPVDYAAMIGGAD